MKIVNNRHEIIFLYDATYCNPNGDPADENKPRTDPETQINLVTDVRLKRTIRDYLHDIEKEKIFVKVEPDAEGFLPDAKTRADDFLDESLVGKPLQEQKDRLDNRILEECIDIRLFGATIPLELKVKVESGKKKKTSVTQKKTSITHTGPVQFQIGRSLHRVTVERIKGTGAFAATKGKEQQTFRIEYIVPYSLIAFHGIVNETRAKETRLTEEDLQALYRGMWKGTKNMITRSKIGLVPRLLLVVKYKEGKFQIGSLDQYVSITHEKDDVELRSPNDYVVNLQSLLATLNEHKDKIEELLVQADSSLVFSDGTSEKQGENGFVDFLKTVGIPVQALNIED